MATKQDFLEKMAFIGPAVERKIFNHMRPPAVTKNNGDWQIDGMNFKSTLRLNADDKEPWSYEDNGKSIKFALKEIKWDTGEVIKTGAASVKGEVSKSTIRYKEAGGPGIHIKINQDNYHWQKIVEIDSLAALGNIPGGAKFLEISFQVSGDFVLPEGEIEGRIHLTEDSDLLPIRAWDSGSTEIDESGVSGHIESGMITKRLPVEWLKTSAFPVFTDVVITFGSELVFNSENTTDISVAVLDSTHFVVAYLDFGGSNDGIARIGVVSGTTISSYGAENVFNAVSTTDISVSALDSTHFVVSYRDVGGSDEGIARIGLVSGTTISSYGAENVFNSAITSRISVSALDSIHFVVAYRDDGGSRYGVARIGAVSGIAISYGSALTFNSAATRDISVSALDSTHFIVAYQDEAGSAYGIARIGVVSGTTISSYGAENVFNSASTRDVSVSALDSTHFVVAYQDEGGSKYGIARIGLVSGTTISSYGAENVFNSAITSYISVSALDSTHFVVAYRDVGGSDEGIARIGLVSGTTISSYGAENAFNSADTTYISVAALNSAHFVVAYRDSGGSTYGIGIVGFTVFPGKVLGVSGPRKALGMDLFQSIMGVT